MLKGSSNRSTWWLHLLKKTLSLAQRTGCLLPEAFLYEEGGPFHSLSDSSVDLTQDQPAIFSWWQTGRRKADFWKSIKIRCGLLSPSPLSFKWIDYWWIELIYRMGTRMVVTNLVKDMLVVEFSTWIIGQGTDKLIILGIFNLQSAWRVQEHGAEKVWPTSFHGHTESIPTHRATCPQAEQKSERPSSAWQIKRPHKNWQEKQKHGNGGSLTFSAAMH